MEINVYVVVATLSDVKSVVSLKALFQIEN